MTAVCVAGYAFVPASPALGLSCAEPPDGTVASIAAGTEDFGGQDGFVTFTTALSLGLSRP